MKLNQETYACIYVHYNSYFSVLGETKVALTAADTPVRDSMGVTGVTVIGIFWQYGKPAVLRSSLVADSEVSPVENSFPFHDTV